VGSRSGKSSRVGSLRTRQDFLTAKKESFEGSARKCEEGFLPGTDRVKSRVLVKFLKLAKKNVNAKKEPNLTQRSGLARMVQEEGEKERDTQKLKKGAS